jgi:hypothetical protein
VLHLASRVGHRFLGHLLRCCHRREASHPESLDQLPSGRPSFTQNMTYLRRFLFIEVAGIDFSEVPF